MNKRYIHNFQRVRNTFHTTNGMNKQDLKHGEDITREILKTNLNKKFQYQNIICQPISKGKNNGKWRILTI